MRISAAVCLLLVSPCFAQIYKDPSVALDRRVEDLLSRMTLEEKISQLMNDSPAIERLDVPRYNWWNESLHGVARAGRATVFPQAIGLAATWDTDLMFRVATTISDEARAKYHEFLRRGKHDIYQGLTFWTPNINLFRDPRWGRGMETYGEDPYLTGQMAVAFIKGMQGDDPKYLKTIATAKHFAVHSGPESARHTLRCCGRARRTCARHTFRISRRPSRRAAPIPSCAPITASTACRRAPIRGCSKTFFGRNGDSRATWSPTAARSAIFIQPQEGSECRGGRRSGDQGGDRSELRGGVRECPGRRSQRAAGGVGCRQGAAAASYGAVQTGHVRSAGDSEVRADSLQQSSTARSIAPWRSRRRASRSCC